MTNPIPPAQDLLKTLTALLRDSDKIQQGLDSAKARIMHKNPHAFVESVQDNENL